MSKFKKAFRICLALLSVLILSSYGLYIETTDLHVVSESVGLRLSYPLVFILSFVYLHHSLGRYLSPLGLLKEPEKTLLYEASLCGYKNSFFNRTIFLGYLVLLFSLFLLVDVEFIRLRPEIVTAMDRMISIAVLLVSLGTLAKARAVTLHLLKERINGEGHIKPEE